MTTSRLPEDIQNQIYAQQFHLLDDPVGQAVDRCYRFGVTDDFCRAELKGRVLKHKIQLAKNPFLKPRLTKGDFCQGFDIDGSEIRYPSQFRNEPTISIATTGSGKSNTSRFEALQFSCLSIKGLWLFDLRKAEFTPLKPYFERMGKNLNVIPARKMKINPLQPPSGVDPTSYASNLSDILVHVLDLPPVATRLLFQTLLYLYQKHGILDGGQNYPTWLDLLKAVIVNKHVHSQAREATILRLETVLLSLRDVLSYRLGWTTEDLAGHHINFQFQDVGETDQNLLLFILLINEFMSRIARGISNPKMDLMIFCDEASRLVSQSESSLSSYIGLIRGTGIGLSLSNQTAELSRSILSNSPNKVMGRCGPAECETMGSALGLNTDQKKWLSVNLQPGLFVMSLGQGSWRHPFLFRVPLLRFKKSDFYSDDTFSSLDSLPVVPAPDFFDWQPSWFREENAVEQTSPISPEEKELHSTEVKVTSEELRFLEAVIENPCQSVSFYPSKIRMSNRHAIKIRKSLLSKNLIKEEKLSTSHQGRGRPTLVLTPTEQALELCGDR